MPCELINYPITVIEGHYRKFVLKLDTCQLWYASPCI